jgi:type I restriction enzyme S subunit
VPGACFQNTLLRVQTFGPLPEYLLHYFRYLAVTGAFAKGSRGVGIYHLGKLAMEQFEIPIAPIAEQRRIVDAFEEHFSRIDVAETMLRSCRVRAKLFEHAVVAEAFRGTWPSRPLHEVADVHLGRQRSPKNHEGPHMRPYLRAANVTWNGLDLKDVKEMNFDPVEAERFALQPGDLLLAEASGSASEVGKPVIWRGEIPGACFQNTLLRVQAKELLPEFLLHYFRHLALTGVFARKSRGVGIHHLGKLAMEQFPVPTPSSKEQASIVSEIEAGTTRIQAAVAAVESALAMAASLRRSVLAQGFSGRLVPPDPGDEPASALIECIRAERASSPTSNPRRKKVTA